ncbi:MAG TPA: PQQ-binding-like beta-propeller repeat protein [Alphaproteobacteria bacterium]|jgi:alcohol dehydrogenase (cytochrome c)|nr:PQQ-binding-like beta-propeller repeat protein [Alphaproteobacteria bacterium]
MRANAVLLAGLLSAVAGPSWGAGKDWPAAGGDLADDHYSTLTQIDTRTVRQLGGAWVHQFDGERSRGTPVVTDGKMFVTAGPHVYAFNPETGAVLWSYKPDTPPIGLFKGVAVGQGLVYVGLMEGVVVALDEKTGVPVWTQTIAEQAAAGGQGGQWVAGAPAYVDGVVIVGLSGARSPVDRNDGRVVGLDAKTGKVKWTFHIVPGPGEAGHDTWPADSDIWKRGGGAVWVTPAVDPALGLVYVGTGNPIPELGGEVRAGDNLYTAAVVALDIKTGKLRWHYQTTHHDIYEMDLGTPLVLYDAKAKGGTRKAIGVMRTDGYLFLLDRLTGKPVFPVEERPVPQSARLKTAPTQPFPAGADQVGPNCVGKDIVPAGFAPGCYFDVIDTDRPNLITPTATMRSSPMAYSPTTGMFYGAGAVAPIWMQRWDDPFVFSGDGVNGVPGVKFSGILAAIDARTDKIVWQKSTPYRIENGSGVTATAGGLLFHGEPDGNLQALDARTGDLLWQFQTGADESGPAAVYESRGQEYVAVMAAGSLWAFKLGGTVQPLPTPPPPPTESAFRGRIEATDHIQIGAVLEDKRAIVKTLSYTNEYTYKPLRAKVKAGVVVTWTNTGKLPHSATAIDGSWTTGEIAPGQSATVTFDKPGSYTYHCTDHPWSYAQLVVE